MMNKKSLPRRVFSGIRARLMLLVLLASLPAFGLALFSAWENPGSGTLTRNLTFVFVCTLLALAVAWMGSQRLIVRKVKALARATDGLATGEYGARTGLNKGGGELNQLAHAFDNMAVMLEERTLKLQQTESKYRTLVEQIPAATYAYHACGEEGSALYISPQIQNILGYSSEEWLADPQLWLKRLHPDDQARVLSQYTNSCTKGEPFCQEYRILSKDGRVVWLRDDARMMQDEVGGAQFMHGIMLDISERKRAEETRRGSESTLAGILDVAQDAIISVDDALSIKLFNKGAEGIFGYRAEEVVGKPLSMLLPQRSHDSHGVATSDFLQSAGETGRPQGEQREVWGRRKDSSEFLAEATISKLNREGSNILTVMLRDVTQRKRAEDALRESESSFRLMFTDNPLPMWLYDLDTLQFLEVNRAAVDRYGYSREEFLGMRANDLRAIDDVPRLIDKKRQNTHPDLQYSLQWRHKRKDGAVMDVQIVTHTLEFAGRKAALVVAEDITERKLAEEAMRASETRFRAVFEGAAIGVALVDMEGKIVKTNPALWEMLGYMPEELRRIPFLELSHPDDIVTHNYRFRELTEGKTEYYQMEKRYYRKDGTLVWANLTVSLVRESKKKGQFCVAMVENITERKRSQEQIKRQLERLAALRNIDMAISASLDLRVTLSVILDQVTSQLHIDAADVLLLNPHKQVLEFAAGRGFRFDAISRSKLRLGESHAGQAALQRRTLSVSNMLESGDLLRAPLLAGEDFLSYSVVPLLVKGQVKGVLEIFHRGKFEADQEWLDFLEALAGQAALAIDNATMFDDLQRSNSELALAYDTTLEGWSRALDLRDKETEGHTRRVTEMTDRLARSMGMSEVEMVHVHRGALLHDIGKMGIPDSILLKPGPLTDEEWEIMRMHPVYAYELLSPISFLRPALDIPYCHHEKWDGTGYPRGLRGEQIPLSARIFAVVDVWDALRSDRPYRQAWPDWKVREHIKSLSGTHFDPQVVRAFIALDIAQNGTMPLDGLLELLEETNGVGGISNGHAPMGSTSSGVQPGVKAKVISSWG